ncbi:MAG TPA: polyprenyl synthetase family protein [Gemmataceae bacterium]|jgi:octaprenyl-diphosphate synthase|nr:polyprenyl synthetase family protein [Gemmataceae bacterium]
MRPSLDWYAPIARDLAEVERVLVQALGSSRPHVSQLVAHLEHYRGKRLRPALLLLTARACGRVVAAHHTLGAVVEMIHTATLVHDDVLDGASLRRHQATVNAGWGNQTSILLGDYLFTHAFHLASTLDDVRACRLIGEATNRVCEGELRQSTESGNLELGEDEYLDIVEGKTAELTSCCCRLGALYANAAPEVVDSLAGYGRWLGIAFQIADDLLDLVGEERAAGKSLGTDVEQQKLTLPLICLLHGARAETAARVRHILASTGNHKREALRPYLAETGALRYAGDRAEEFAGRARAELECLPPSDCRHILELLTDRVVHRND